MATGAHHRLSELRNRRAHEVAAQISVSMAGYDHAYALIVIYAVSMPLSWPTNPSAIASGSYPN